MLGYDLNVIERGIRGIFGREFITRQRKAVYTKFSTIIDSDKEEEKYNAISTIPQLAEVNDERVLSGFSDYTYTLKNKVYMNGIKIPRTLFEFDQTGQIRTLVQSCGSRVANFPDKLMADTIRDGGATGGANESQTGYDGKVFFSTAHDLGDGNTQSNYLVGNTSDDKIQGTTKTDRDDTIAAFQMDLVKAKSKMLELLDDRGEPWHDYAEPEDLIIICHPGFEFFVRTALEANIISDTGNLTVKSVGNIVTINREAPFTTEADAFKYGTWYLAKIDSPLKPFIFQRFGPKSNFPDTIPEADQSVMQALNSVEVQTVMRAGSNVSEHTFFDDEYLLGARVIYSAGYGMWQNIIKIDGAA